MGTGTWGNTATGKVGGSSGSAGGWGNTANGPINGAAAPKKPGRGGILGELKSVGNTVEHPFEQAGHYIGQQGVNVGTGLYGIGTGIYTIGKAEGQAISNDLHGRNKKLNNKEWSDLFHGHIIRMFQEAGKAKGANSPEAIVSGFDKSATVGYPGQVKQVVEHPQKNLFNDVVTLAPLAGGTAGTFGRMSDAAVAARAGESAATIARIAVRGTEPGVRTLNVPGNRLEPPVTADGEPAIGPAAKVETTTQVQLNQGRSYLSRYGAKVHDTLVQRALNNIPTTGRTGVVGKYALMRGAKGLEEEANRTANVRDVQVGQLEHAGNVDGLSREESSLATVLRAGNVLPEEMAQMWRQGASEGVVRVPQEDGTVVSAKVQPADRERMLKMAAVADSLAQKGALRFDKTGNVEANGDLFPQLAERSALEQGASNTRETAILSTNPRVTTGGLQGRKNLVARVAGVDREGQSFVSLKPHEKQSPLSRFSRSNSNSIPQTKNISLGEKATGTGLALGRAPADATREVAGGLRAANRVRGTNDLRGTMAAHGHDVRQTADDWLVAKDLPSKVENMPDSLKVLLGKLRDTELSPAEEQSAISKWNDWAKENLLNRDATHAVGQAAPDGWKWVNRHLVPDSLKHNAQARGTIEKQIGKLSTGVTAATVYFKPGHIPQRITTNLAANIVHGSVNPVDVPKSISTLKDLSKTDRHRLAAATGTHGYQSLPVEGTGFTARAASKGANFYAKRIDAFFRQNAALYELRRIGYDTPAKVSKALDAIENGAKLPGHELMKVNGAFRRANREAMDYETNALEKRTIQRALWFYGFSKAATRFAGHTVTEHPGKTGVIGALGSAGNQEQRSTLGPAPSYEGGLTAVSGGKYPLTVDLSTLIPSGTVAREAEALAHPLGAEGIGSFLNPVYAGAQAVAQGKGAKGFLSQAFQPTPELQALTAGASPRKDGGTMMFPTSSQYLFGRTGESTLLRAVVGSALTPRRVNRAKLNVDAAREHQKKREITIYSP